MKEVFETHHGTISDSMTTTLGRFIYRVAVSGIAIQRVTLLRANEPAQSDHLGIVIDLDLKYLFNNACSPLVYPSPRKLTSDNATSVKKYVAYIRKQFQTHKIVERFVVYVKLATSMSLPMNIDSNYLHLINRSWRSCWVPRPVL